MHLGDLVATDVTLPPGAGAIDITGISSDSGAAGPGFLFAALPGVSVDGARYAGAAVDAGAVAVLAGAGSDVVVPPDVPVLRADDPRRALSWIASRFYPRQPERMVAVTGTSGKTSVVSFAREIFTGVGLEAASLGTVGVVSGSGTKTSRHTTPDPIVLHETLNRLAGEGVTHAALEASSHGLDQRRLDAVRIVAAGFTNLGRDHLDYHASVADYLAAKLRLFTTILPPDGVAVIDMDGSRSAEVLATVRERGLEAIGVGRAGSEIRLTDVTPQDFRQRLTFEAFGRGYDVVLPLAGEFQASNALIAAGLAIAAGVAPEPAFEQLSGLTGAPGRLECVGRKANEAMVFVDYAHKPEAVAAALQALRPMTEGKLIVVLGAGGDRDPGKRQLMGASAAVTADTVIVTDDNPRSEDPAEIRAAVMAGAPGAIEIADRAEAIAAGIAMLESGDVLCVAGKGHETGQIVGNETLPFSDHAVVRSALAAEEAA